MLDLRADAVLAHLALHIVELQLFIGGLFDLLCLGTDLLFQLAEIVAALAYGVLDLGLDSLIRR